MRTLFWLGTHKAAWLARTAVPLFVSRRTLYRRKTLPRALGWWALDSGGFTELSLHGGWTFTAGQYAQDVRRFRDEVGRLAWAATMDWMCEPFMLAKTGLPVKEHQARTVESLLRLLEIDSTLPWLPVLQGWERDDYFRHLDLYTKRGIDLAAWPLVGLGSVCRRQNTAGAEALIRELDSLGVRLHGFGFKLEGLRRVGNVLASADSMAWSFDARRAKPLPGHPHKSCANCLGYALKWRDKALSAISQPKQGSLW